MVNILYKRGVKYYYYDTFDTWNDARKRALYYKKRNKSRYIIMKTSPPYWFPMGTHGYRLYLSKIRRIGW